MRFMRWKSIHPSELESRQSHETPTGSKSCEHPPLGIGIKAKLRAGRFGRVSGASTPRNWNQGKAGVPVDIELAESIHPSELESRQSSTPRGPEKSFEHPPLGIGIKAKLHIVHELFEHEHPPLGIGIKAKR